MAGQKLGKISHSFYQLDGLAGLLARYAVMENIYYKPPALTLTVESQTAFLEIGELILTYFAHALTATEILRDSTGDAQKISGE